MTARAGLRGNGLWLIYLGEHPCHNSYCAHIICGPFSFLFFLFSGRIFKKLPPTTKKKVEREKEKKTLLMGPGKVIKGLKSSLCGGADMVSISTGDMLRELEGKRNIHHNVTPPSSPPQSAINQQALYRLTMKMTGLPCKNKILKSITVPELSNQTWHGCVLTNTGPCL